MVRALRPEGEQRGRGAAGRGGRSHAGRARWRGARAASRPPRSPSPARIASIVIAVSQPKPAASGKTAVARLLGQTPLPRERLARRDSPTASRIRRRAASFAIPKPPPCFCAKAAIARSLSPSSSGVRSPRRSASQRRRSPGAASRSPSVSAWPFPRCGSRTTRAPASSATRGGCVARAVVGDDHLRLRELPPQLRDGRPDPRFLVARRDEDRQGLTHQPAGSGSIDGRIPLVAVSRMP